MIALKPPCTNGRTSTPLSTQQLEFASYTDKEVGKDIVYIIGHFSDTPSARIAKQTIRKNAINEFLQGVYSAPYVGCNGADGTYFVSYLIEVKAQHANRIIDLFNNSPDFFNEDTIEDYLIEHFEAEIVDWSDCVAPDGEEIPAIVVQTSDLEQTFISYDAMDHHNGFYGMIFGRQTDYSDVKSHVNKLLKTKDSCIIEALRNIIKTPGRYYVECFYVNISDTDEWLQTADLDIYADVLKPEYLITL